LPAGRIVMSAGSPLENLPSGGTPACLLASASI
jgi:hypothetical protein